jgi:hypothetical protein
MNKLLLLLFLPFALHAEPVKVLQEEVGAKVFEFFKYDSKKAKPDSKAKLEAELFPVIPVYFTQDTNQTPIKLQGATFGTNQLYSYGTSSFSFDTFKSVDKDLNRVFKQKFAVNFRSPEGVVAGDTRGRLVHVHFDQPVTYFGAWFQCAFGDPDNVSATMEKLQFIVNGQIVEYPNLEDTINTKFMGVYDSVPFTDLDIVPTGTPGHALSYILDRPQFK